MSKWLHVRMICPECRVRFESIMPDAGWPEDGCPECGEMPEDYDRFKRRPSRSDLNLPPKG